MALPPIVVATIQSSLITATSNIVAQLLTAYRSNTPFVMDWVPFFQFLIFGLISTPPNFMWQEFLESAFPATTPSKTPSPAVKPKSKSKPQQQQQQQQQGQRPPLNKTNTLIKTLLDQTVGAALNTLLFSTFMFALQAAMRHRPAAAEHSLGFLLAGPAHVFRYDQVPGWEVAWQKATGEFWAIMKAGWTFWPFVSVVNFAVLETVAARNLMGSLAGLGWGCYMSLVAAA